MLRLGEGDGWGTTNATAAAISALAEGWRRPTTPIALTLTQGAERRSRKLSTRIRRSLRVASAENTPLVIANGSNAPVIALVETSYEPTEPGAKAPASSEGFA